MTRPHSGVAFTPESWRYRLLNSPEWRQLVSDYRNTLAQRAISGGFDSVAIAEMSRDLRGLQAFTMWIENHLAAAAKEGRIDGRAQRYRQQARQPAGGAGAAGDAGGIDGE